MLRFDSMIVQNAKVNCLETKGKRVFDVSYEVVAFKRDEGLPDG